MAPVREALSSNETVSFKEASVGEASVFLTSVLILDLSALFLAFAFLLVLSLFSADLCVGNAFLLAFFSHTSYNQSNIEPEALLSRSKEDVSEEVELEAFRGVSSFSLTTNCRNGTRWFT